jgi:hypothetical protein
MIGRHLAVRLLGELIERWTWERYQRGLSGYSSWGETRADMRMSRGQLADEWAVVLACILLLVIVLAVIAQQPSKVLYAKNCPVPPGPWQLTTLPDGTQVCIDPARPSFDWSERYPGLNDPFPT